MGITDKQAQPYAKALEEKGFLKRTARIGSSNSFDLQPRFDALASALTASKQPTVVKKAA